MRIEKLSRGRTLVQIYEGDHEYVLSDSTLNELAAGFDKFFPEPTWQDQPTKDGYWWFEDDCNDLKIVDVYWTDNDILGTQVSFCGTDDDQDLIDITGKWYGPIMPPKED